MPIERAVMALPGEIEEVLQLILSGAAVRSWLVLIASSEP